MRLLPLLALTALAGCATEVGGDRGERVGQAIQPVIAGQASAREAVVVLARYDETGARRGFCTGTLVAGNLLLTARHCVAEVEPRVGCSATGEAVVGGAVLADRDPAALRVFVGGAAVTRSLDFQQADASVTSLLVPDGANLCNRDLAFAVLDRKIPGAETAPLRLAGGGQPGESLTSVGFGLTEAGTLPSERRERQGVTVGAVGPESDADDARYGIGPSEFKVGESVCSGDSGGPAFAVTGAVVGVAGRVGGGVTDPENPAGRCTGAEVYATYTHLGEARALVTAAFAAAGATPWIEGQPKPGTTPKAEPAAPCDPGKAACGPPAPATDGSSSRETRGAVIDTARPPREDDAGGCSASPARGSGGAGLVATALALVVARARRRRITR